MNREYPISRETSLRFHGATRGVTGSCHELRSGTGGLLVDCGAFQGHDARQRRPLARAFESAPLHGLIVTHAHIDHMGRIPELLAAGFRGPIFCSPPTAALLPVQLEDSLRLGYSTDRRLVRRVVDRVVGLIRAVPYDSWHPAGPAFRFRLRRAGHILGSAWVELDIVSDPAAGRIVFSGDLGAPYAPLLPSPRSPERADVVVMESTYGDRDHHGRRDRKRHLGEVLTRAAADGGVVIIPCFALGRAQELLYELNALVEAGSLDIPVIMDSPLAGRFTDVYEKMKRFWNDEAGRRLAGGDHPFRFRRFLRVSGARQHRAVLKRLRAGGGPAIVLASSGMCTGGRVVDYLKTLLPDPGTDVVFAGYQAAGTPGRRLREARPGSTVRLDGRPVRIRARVHGLTGYSAHAGRRDLLRWAGGIRRGPRTIFLVHGDAGPKKALKEALSRVCPARVILPAPGRGADQAVR